MHRKSNHYSNVLPYGLKGKSERRERVDLLYGIPHHP